MESELHKLEERIGEIAALSARLRAENLELRQRVASLDNDNRRLQGKIDQAAERLEHLLANGTFGSQPA
jgi:chromosome segregation ATPase